MLDYDRCSHWSDENPPGFSESVADVFEYHWLPTDVPEFLAVLTRAHEAGDLDKAAFERVCRILSGDCSYPAAGNLLLALVDRDSELREQYGLESRTVECVREYADAFGCKTCAVDLLLARESQRYGELLNNMPATLQPELRKRLSAFQTVPSDTRPVELQADDRFGKYRIIRKLGEGGMGQVWLASDDAIGRQAALKVVRPGKLNLGRLERFRDEVRRLVRVDHPNVVGVYDGGDIDGVPYFAMEYVEGGDLKQACDGDLQGQIGNSGWAAGLVRQVALGVQALHERQIVHHDLKPQNVLMDGDVPKVADLGLSADSGETDSRGGTPPYMAPEQVAGRGETDSRTDVYALGVLLCELLTGRRPFEGTTEEIFEQIRSQTPELPAEAAGRIPADLQAICLKCLKRDPDHRYQTAEELADDLDSFLHWRPTAARPPRAIRWTGMLLYRHRIATTVMVLTLLLAIGGPLAAWNQSRLNSSLQAANGELDQKNVQLEAANEENLQTNRKLNRTLESEQQLAKNLEHRSAELRRSLAERTRALHTEYVRRGLEELVDRQSSAGLAWLAGSPLFDIDPDEAPDDRDRDDDLPGDEVSDAERGLARRNLLRLSTFLDHSPRLVHVWVPDFGEQTVHATFTPDGSRVITCCADDRIRIRNRYTGRVVLTSDTLPSVPLEVVLRGDRCLVRFSKSVRFLDLSTGKLLDRSLTRENFSYIHDVWFNGSTGGVVAVATHWSNAVDTGDELRDLVTNLNLIMQRNFPATSFIQLWDEQGEPEATIPLAGNASEAAIDSTGRWLLVRIHVAGSFLQQLVDLQSRTIQRLPLPEDPVLDRAARFVPLEEGYAGIVSKPDSRVAVVNLATGEEQYSTLLPSAADIDVSPDGSTIVAARSDGRILLWSPHSGRDAELRQPGSLARVLFSPDGGRFAVATFDGTFKVWNTGRKEFRQLSAGADREGGFAADPLPIEPVFEHGSPIRHLEWSPEGRYLLSVGNDGVTRVWDVAGNPFPQHSLTAVHRASVPNRRGDRIAVTGSDERAVTVWQTGDMTRHGRILSHRYRAVRLAWHPDGRHLATVSVGENGEDAELRMFDTDTSLLVRGPFPVRSHFQYFSPAPPVFSPDGRYLALAEYGTGQPAHGMVWDLETAREGSETEGILQFEGPVCVVQSALEAGFDASGHIFLMATERGAQKWDLRKDGEQGEGIPLASFRRDVAAGATLQRVMLVPGGSLVAGLWEDSSDQNWLEFQEIATGQPVTSPFFLGSGIDPWKFSFSPSGRRFLTVNQWGSRVWDSETGEPLTPLLRSEFAACTLSADDQTVATVERLPGSGSAVVRLRELPGGDLLVPPIIQENYGVENLHIGPEARWLVVGGTLRQFATSESPSLVRYRALKQSGRRINDRGRLVPISGDEVRQIASLQTLVDAAGKYLWSRSPLEAVNRLLPFSSATGPRSSQPQPAQRVWHESNSNTRFRDQGDFTRTWHELRTGGRRDLTDRSGWSTAAKRLDEQGRHAAAAHILDGPLSVYNFEVYEQRSGYRVHLAVQNNIDQTDQADLWQSAFDDLWTARSSDLTQGPFAVLRDGFAAEGGRRLAERRRKELERRIAAASQWLQRHPGTPIASGWRGLARVQLEQWDEAEQDVRKAAGGLPDDWRMHAMLSEVLAHRGNTEESLSVLEQAGQLGGTGARWDSVRGFVLATAGRSAEAAAVYSDLQFVQDVHSVPIWQAAFSAFDALVQKDENDAAALIGRGLAQLELERYPEAHEDFSRAIDLLEQESSSESADDFNSEGVLSPQNSLPPWVVYAGRGLVYYRLGMNNLDNGNVADEELDAAFEFASKDFSVAFERGCRNGAIAFQAGSALLKVDQVDHAAVRDALTRAIDLGWQTAMVREMRGNAHRALGQYDLAVQDYTEAADLMKDVGAAKYILQRAQCRLLAGDRSAGIADVLLAASLSPFDFARAEEKGRVLLELGRWTDARDAFLGAAQLAKDPYDLLFSCRMGLLACLQAGDSHSARWLSQYAFDRTIDSTDEGTALELTQIAARSRGLPPHLADILIGRLTGQAENDAEAASILGELHLSRGEQDQAADWFDRSLEMGDSLFEPALFRAGIAAKCGDRESADHWMQEADRRFDTEMETADTVPYKPGFAIWYVYLSETAVAKGDRKKTIGPAAR